MSENYAREKFYEAALILAQGEGEIKERLAHAALVLVTIRPEEDLPKEFRRDFESIYRDLTREPAEIEGEGKIHATIRKLAPTAAREIAARIFHMYVYLLHGSGL